MPTYEAACPWCPHSMLVRIKKDEPPESGEALDLDQDIINELIAIVKLHLEREQGKDHHPKHLDDEEIKKKSIFKVIHLPGSNPPRPPYRGQNK